MSRTRRAVLTCTQSPRCCMTGDDQNTVKRKVTEIFRALEFEKNYSKQEILELYLNTIYLGNGCYGVQTAAQYYFGKDVSQLTVAECASLIGITNNPSVYSPLRNDKTRANNKERQENILKEMLSQGYIDETAYQSANSETLTFTDGSTTADELVAAAEAGSTESSSQYNSYFVDQVIRDVVSDMSLIVQKFGGSSVKDARRIRNVAGIIAETYLAGNDVLVVLSAQGDTTDDLIAKAAEINDHPSKREMDMLLSTGEQISIALCAMFEKRRFWGFFIVQNLSGVHNPNLSV